MSEVVGTVIGLFRYPVKSMAGEPLSAVEVDWQGIEGDRQFSFVRAGNRSRFPWLTARELPELVRYRPRFRDPEVPRFSSVDVQLPDGGWTQLDAPDLIAALAKGAGEELELLQLGRGTHDAMPISVVSTATHGQIDEAHGRPLDPRRFRSNILIESEQSEASWCGRRFSFGGWPDSAELLMAIPIERCVMISIDPDTAERDPAIVKTIVRKFDNKVGSYATASKPGLIRIGDKVTANSDRQFCSAQ
jgi:uncharacterized protein